MDTSECVIPDSSEISESSVFSIWPFTLCINNHNTISHIPQYGFSLETIRFNLISGKTVCYGNECILLSGYVSQEQTVKAQA